MSRRILVIDDEQGIRAALGQLLEFEGYDVRAIPNAAEGIEEYKKWRPHLVFLDVKMAGMDGMEALKRIKANTYERRLLKRDGNPNFYVRFYILNSRGEYAGVAMYDLNDDGKRATFAICDENGPQNVPFDALLQGKHTE